MKAVKFILIFGIVLSATSGFAYTERDIYNRVKGKSWNQLSSEEKNYAQQNGLADADAYKRWTSKMEGGGTSTDPDAPSLGINEAALQGMASQEQGAAVNMAAGAALMAAGIAGCQGTQTWGCPLIPMAVMAFMQSGHDSASAGESNNTQTASKTDPTNTTDGENGTPTKPTDKSKPAYTGKVKENIDKAADMGYVVDPVRGTVTTPDGTMPTSAFSSPAAMAAAGMSPQTIAAANKALAESQNATTTASVGSMGVDGGAGGGGSGSGSDAPSGSSLDDYFSSLKKPSKADRDRMVAGKSLMYGNDPIGVKVDNIFLMVHRRYQNKRKVNSYFLERSLPVRPNINP